MAVAMRYRISTTFIVKIKWVDGDGWCVRPQAGLSGCRTGSSSDITFGHMPQHKPNQTLPSFVSITRQKMFLIQCSVTFLPLNLNFFLDFSDFLINLYDVFQFY